MPYAVEAQETDINSRDLRGKVVYQDDEVVFRQLDEHTWIGNGHRALGRKPLFSLIVFCLIMIHRQQLLSQLKHLSATSLRQRQNVQDMVRGRTQNIPHSYRRNRSCQP